MATEEAITEENENQKIRRTCLNDVLKIIDDCKTNKGIKLDLSNRLVNLIPDELLQLSHIQYLYLERSHLQEIPESISEYLTQLKWLDVRHNNLKCLPQNLFLLKNLKNLLLEGNELISLPLKLGLLTSLSGLNLTNNPLEFPPKYVIESGTKAILQFLREQLAIEQRFGQMELNDVAPNSKRTLQVHGKIHKNPYVEKTTPPVESCTVGYDESTTGAGDLGGSLESKIELTKAIAKEQIPSKHTNINQSNQKISTTNQFRTTKKKTEDEKNPKNLHQVSTSRLRKTLIPGPSVLPKNFSFGNTVNKKTGRTKLSITVTQTERKSGKQHVTETESKSRKKKEPNMDVGNETLNVLRIFRKTDKSLRDLNKTEKSEKCTEERNEEKDLFSHLESKTIRKIHIEKRIDLSSLEIGDMVAIGVNNKHFIPGQPSIGKIITLPDYNGYVVVHYYTGSYDGKWWPMMCRQSPYSRDIKVDEIYYKFQLDDNGKMVDRDANFIRSKVI